MTEEKWLSAANPLQLLMHMRRSKGTGLRSTAGRRKFRLFGCACVRRVWAGMSHKALRTAIEVSERFADGEATSEQLEVAWSKAHGVHTDKLHSYYCATERAASDNIWDPARAWKYTTESALDSVRGNKPAQEKRILAALVRCFYGNPFRPPIIFNPAWRTSDVMLLARGIYDERAFDRMPILADALQDAGCDSDDILNHCRDTTTPHARGCWVVDLVLGKS